MITENQLHRELETLLELPENSVSSSDTLESIRWDSMAVVMFIAMADDKFSIAVPPSKLADAKTVDDVFKLLTE